MRIGNKVRRRAAWGVALAAGGAVALVALVALVAGAAALPASPASPALEAQHAPAAGSDVIQAVGAENFYANVIQQIGGRHVAALGIISNPATDPHSYESSTTDAAAVARASLIVQNGLGYDAFMQKLAAASPNKARTVIDVGQVFGRKAGDNPHQWYDPATMPRVAGLVAAVLARLDPADRETFQANLRRFDASLKPWIAHIAALRRRYKGAPIAVTEPVFGYAAQAVGLRVLTPRSFQLAIQEGNDPAPQDVQAVQNLLIQQKVKVFLYNLQAVEPITERLLGLARAHHIPIVGVYESMPLSSTYQSWMEAELNALDLALSHGRSTERIT